MAGRRRRSDRPVTGRSAASSISVAPFAPGVLAGFRAAGHRLVLSTTTPYDLVVPFADALGFDAVVATRYEVVDGRYTGRLEGGFVWGLGKLQAVKRWAAAEGLDLADCHACSDSVFDIPLLSSVGSPHAVNPDAALALVAVGRRWPIEYWDRPSGVPSVIGLEPYHFLRPLVRPQSFPYARFDVDGVDAIPARGPVLLASNHRSYFDVAALALVAARLGRPVRFLGKQELFDAPGARLGGAGDRRYPGRSGQRLDPPAAAGRGRAASRRGRHRPAAGDDPAGRGVLRPGAPRQDGYGPPGRGDRCAGRAGRPVGHRAGLAAVGQTARRHRAGPPADRPGPRRPCRSGSG